MSVEIVQDQAVKLLCPHDFAQAVTQYISRSEIVGTRGSDSELLVYWGLDEMQSLARIAPLHYKLPSPIERDYAWPGMFTPFEHQRDTARFLTLHKRAFCFNEAGTGKTSAAIWAADYLMSQGLVRRCLVICPLSIMQAAWQSDLFKTAMHRTSAIAHGSTSRREKIIRGAYDFVIINFDGVGTVDKAIAESGFDLVVVDECFVSGTLVATPSGRRPIEQLQSGDKVLTSDGVAPISCLVRNTATRLVEVKLGNGKVIQSTPEHPFFTDAGWVCAKNLAGRRLVSGVELSCLRAGISPSAAPGVVGYGKQPSDWVDLLEILRTEEIPLSESRSQLLQQNVARATRQAYGPENSGASSEAVRNAESYRSQAESTGREWQRYDASRAVDFRGLACGVGMELPSSVGREATRLSYELQDRLRVARPDGGIGSGWQQPHSTVTTSAGSQEGSKTGDAWVESVSYIECPGGVDVFNLEIEGTPNYLIGDHWIVHNCNAYKNPTTKRWKILSKLLRSDSYLWMMTGTPAAQSPMDAYGLAKMVNPTGIPKTMTGWQEKVMQQYSRFVWKPKPNSRQTVFDALQPAIRYEKADCLDLPEVMYQTREVPLTQQVQKYYKELKEQMLIQAVGEQITTVNAAAALTKLLQLSGGAVYTDEKNVVEFDVSPRLNVLKEVIEESSHKLIVFVPFSHTIRLVCEFLTKSGISNEAIQGDVTARQRSAIFNSFQTATDPRVLVIQPQAASHGVTLTAADTVVFWSPVTSVETYLQCIARIDRVGQKNKMTVIHLEGSEVERRMYTMLQSKVDMHERLVDLYREEMGITNE